ncbi:alpha/beta fold hydrolase [Streptomyces iranensis]|uniref:Alpha/beta hydrolase fold containing protein n=1 Tax=Streptomyces iranensis TaxID=576784 RepID=A0A061AA37_9ACTN|nr:alpha/beta hydrolase [Streptomyces iranensis]MBP2068461.1 pimeloyl-ACP methyl ester carboxylesterase [Streptomyces iranensis]CDR15616.1 alpha/beta hydrolase fold containing protein [Streptomyces iranensis]
MSVDPGRYTTPVRQSGGDAEQQPVIVRCARRALAPDPLRVLLLHGLCSNAGVWDPFVPLADPRCELWTADLPWRGTGVHGWTGLPVETWAGRAVAAVPGGPDVVIAHSFGTSAALTWLDRWSSGGADTRGPSAVVLVSPLYRATAEEFDWNSLAYYVNNFDRILIEGMHMGPSRRLPAERRHTIAMKIRDLVSPYGWFQFFGTYLRMPQMRTERMTMPFLLVSGGEDMVAAPSDAEGLAKSLPDASVHVLPCHGHFPMVTAAEEFADLTNTFLRTRLPGPPSGSPHLTMEHNR